jgi:hypothetical protein
MKEKQSYYLHLAMQVKIMQYQYPASNQYWKSATDPLHIWLLSKQFC